MPRRQRQRRKKADTDSDSDDDKTSGKLTKRQARRNREMNQLALRLVDKVHRAVGGSLLVAGLNLVLKLGLLGAAARSQLTCTSAQLWAAVEGERSYGNIVDRWLIRIGQRRSCCGRGSYLVAKSALTVQCFNMERMKWSEEAVPTHATSQSPTTHFSHASMMGKLYILGGWQKQHKGPKRSTLYCYMALYPRGGVRSSLLDCRALPGILSYDPLTNTLEEIAQLRIPRYGHASCALEGKLYTVGGKDSSSRCVILPNWLCNLDV